jgi:uncharacterized protein YndB with AHSA1/START domain
MTEPVGTREIELTRVYEAPPETLFELWTEADHLARWWGPDGFSAPKVVSDPRPGGELTIVMAGPGFEQTLQARYREVDRPRRLVVESVVAGPDGQAFLESSHTVTVTDLGGRTEVRVVARAAVFQAAGLAALEGMRAGWAQSLQCLDDAVHGAHDRVLVLTRLYDAPPAAVFERWVEQRHLERWWGPEGFSVTVEQIDVRPGGTWRFTMHGPDGTDYENTLHYHEVVPGERLVYDHGEPGDPDFFTSVVTFEEMGGRTALSLRLIFPTAAARDSAVDTYHALEGGTQTLARLAALLDAA